MHEKIAWAVVSGVAGALALWGAAMAGPQHCAGKAAHPHGAHGTGLPACAQPIITKSKRTLDQQARSNGYYNCPYDTVYCQSYSYVRKGRKSHP